MSSTINVFIQNGGAGTWLALPASKDDFQKALRGISAVSPDNIFISEYKSDVAALPADLLMKANLDHVNYLASRFAVMDEKQFAMLDAIMESPFRFTTIEQFIDYAYNEDYFLFRSGINDTAALGRYYVFDTGLCQMPNEWKGGIDLDKFGAHAARQERGVFTSVGYLMLTGDEWQNGFIKCGIPDEYRLY